MSVGFYRNQGGGTPVAASAYSSYLVNTFGANLISHMDAQEFLSSSTLIDGQALNGINLQTGETITTSGGATDVTFTNSAINGKPAFVLDTTAEAEWTMGSSAVGLTEYTYGAVALVQSNNQNAGFIKHQRVGGAADYELTLLQADAVADQIGIVWGHDGVDTATSLIAPTANNLLYFVCKRFSVANGIEIIVSNIPSGINFAAPIVPGLIFQGVNNLVFSAQPTSIIGGNQSQPFWLGETFFINRRLTDAELTNLDADMKSKWS